MGVCSSRKPVSTLQRSGAVREIEINFPKLPQIQQTKEPERKQRSFTNLINQAEKMSNNHTQTYNLAPTEHMK